MYSEDDLLQLSALQHLLFCERQCALIHLKLPSSAPETAAAKGGDFSGLVFNKFL